MSKDLHSKLKHTLTAQTILQELGIYSSPVPINVKSANALFSLQSLREIIDNTVFYVCNRVMVMKRFLVLLSLPMVIKVSLDWLITQYTYYIIKIVIDQELLLYIHVHVQVGVE